MGEKVEQEVETRFSVTGNAQSAAGQIGQSMTQLGGVIGRVTAMINPLNTALGAIGGALSFKAITDLGSKFEQTQIVLGGFFDSLGVSSDYADGFNMASKAMDKIRIDAAALPGEADEYIEVFKSGLPVLQKAVGGTLQDVMTFSNKYTAIAKTLQVDAGQAARDLSLMMREGKGGAGADVRTFMQLLPFLRQVEGQANLTTESFNKMTSPERAKVMTAAFAQLQPMLDKSASSFDAMWGAMKSNTENILRLVTRPLFEASKKGLEGFNNLLYDSSGELTGLGKTLTDIGGIVANGLVDGLQIGMSYAKQLWDVFKGFRDSSMFKALETTFEKGLDMVGKIGSGIGALSGVLGGKEAEDSGPMAELSGATAILAVAFGELGPVAIAISAVFASLMKHGDAMQEIFLGLNDTMYFVMEAAGPLIDIFLELADMAGDMVATILPPLIGALNNVLGALMPLWFHLTALYQTVMAQLKPALEALWAKVGGLVTAIGNMLVPVLKWLGEIIGWVASAYIDVMMPVIKAVVKALGWLIDGITNVVNWINVKLGNSATAKDTVSAGGNELASTPIQAQATAPDMTTAQESPASLASIPVGGGAPGGGAVGGGGRATQDFRFSRFEITQKFAEGYDPDRIAVAFAQDVGRIGETRSQSGFEPLFTIR